MATILLVDDEKFSKRSWLCAATPPGPRSSRCREAAGTSPKIIWETLGAQRTPAKPFSEAELLEAAAQVLAEEIK